MFQMQLRLFALSAIRCLPRHQIILSRQLSFVRCTCTVQPNLKPATSNLTSIYYQQCRFRKKGPKRPKTSQDEDSDSDIDDEPNDQTDEPKQKYDVEPGAKLIDYRLDSPRTDRLLRKALNLSGKAVEELFYGGKIQVNGEVLMKKSRKMHVGDMITVPLEAPSGKTARGALIEVLEIVENETYCSVKVSRNKSTLISV